MPTRGGDEASFKSLAAAGVEGPSMRSWYDDLVDTSFWIREGASQHSFAVAASLHDNTRAAIAGSTGVLETARGAAAGTTLADAIFGGRCTCSGGTS